VLGEQRHPKVPLTSGPSPELSSALSREDRRVHDGRSILWIRDEVFWRSQGSSGGQLSARHFDRIGQAMALAGGVVVGSRMQAHDFSLSIQAPTYAARCSPVRVERAATRSAGVPSKTIWPPSCPAPGPRSMIQSA